MNVQTTETTPLLTVDFSQVNPSSKLVGKNLRPLLQKHADELSGRLDRVRCCCFSCYSLCSDNDDGTPTTLRWHPASPPGDRAGGTLITN